MAMNGAQLGLEMAAATRAIFSAISQTTPVSDAEVNAIWRAAGVAIVDHVQAHGTVTVTTGSSAGTYPVQ